VVPAGFAVLVGAAAPAALGVLGLAWEAGVIELGVAAALPAAPVELVGEVVAVAAPGLAPALLSRVAEPPPQPVTTISPAMLRSTCEKLFIVYSLRPPSAALAKAANPRPHAPWVHEPLRS